jgi:hypothetical protein
MLKFDLTRKYLVGLLTLAMVLSLFVMPASAAPDPIVNAPADYELLLALDHYDGTVTSTLVLNLTDVTGFLTIRVGGVVLTNVPSTSYFVVQSGVPSYLGQMTPDTTGKYTFATGTTGSDTTWTYYAWTDTNTNGILDLGEPLSNPVDITWYTPELTSIVVDPDVATNTVPATPTHTIIVTLKDQFGADYEVVGTATPVTVKINGLNNQTTKTVTVLVGKTSTTFAYMDAFTLDSVGTPVYKTGTDTLVFTSKGKTATATKFWVTSTSTAYNNYAFNPENGTGVWNYVGDPHKTGIYFYADNGGLYTGTVTYDLIFKVVGTNSITTKSAGATKAGKVEWTYTSTQPGWDVITITGTITAAGTATTVAGTFIKYWIYPWSIQPESAVNLLGTEHSFVLTGAPGDEVEVTFNSAGIFDLQNLDVEAIAPAGYTIDPMKYTLPCVAANVNHIDVVLDATGTATITVASQAPGKFYLDAAFEPGPGWDYVPGAGPTVIVEDDRDPVELKAAKCYAELTGFMVEPKEEINPITQNSAWDTHTVTAWVLGDFPTKYAPVPPISDPTELYGPNAYWQVAGGILFVRDASLANVPVDWTVEWEDVSADRQVISPDETDHYFDTTDDPPYYFTATGISDADGQAVLKYKLVYLDEELASTCVPYFPCLTDAITVEARYPYEELNEEWGTATTTATKIWRDYPFKLVKYNGHLDIGPGDYIPGAKFFLKLNNFTITGTTATVTYMIPAGNAYQQLDPTKLWLATTDTVGEAIFYHLPFGTYYLWEYYAPPPYTLGSPPVNTGITFTIDEDTTWWWCNPTGLKIKTEYYVNTPTSPHFYKITWCGTRMVGVTFEVTNLDTVHTHSYTTDANGRVTISPSDFTPFYDSALGTIYKVHEVSNAVLTSYGVKAVPDFYFEISNKGTWDGFYYVDEDCTVKGWGPETYSWAWYNGSRLWVVDPKIGTEPPLSKTVTIPLRYGWNMVDVGVGTAQTVSALFGSNFQAAWVWNPITSLYDWMGSVAPTPGRGFWVYMNATGTVTITGVEVSSPQTLNLLAGWNMIANPFDVAIPWTKVKLNGAAMTPTTYVYSYNGIVYEPVIFATGSLAIGEGYWIYMASAGTIEFSR